MKKCVKCGKRGLFLKLDADKRCTSCAISEMEAQIAAITKKMTAMKKQVETLDRDAFRMSNSIRDLNFHMSIIKLELADVQEPADPITVRKGAVYELVEEFLQLDAQRWIKFDIVNLENPEQLVGRNIAAIHYADEGAQGDEGSIRILYRSENGVQILYGNYHDGNLNLDAVIRKLPMLKYLDSRIQAGLPYPFAGSLELPEGWQYAYMGALNHFFARDSIPDIDAFIKAFIAQGGRGPQLFRAVAWYCEAPCLS